MFDGSNPYLRTLYFIKNGVLQSACVKNIPPMDLYFAVGVQDNIEVTITDK